jgi:hypothetical protein
MAEENPLLTQSRAALDRHRHRQGREAMASPTKRSPDLGDVYALQEAAKGGVRWVVIANHPSRPETCQVAPADSNELAGSADIAISDTSGLGPLVLRSRFARSLDRNRLEARWHLGQVGQATANQARTTWSAIAGGEAVGTVLAREVDEDPEYQDWLAEVVIPACEALEKSLGEQVGGEVKMPAEGALVDSSQEPLVEGPGWRTRRVLYPLAASLLLAFGSVELWRVRQQMQTLETMSRVVEERHRETVERLAGDHQRTVERLGEEHEQTVERFKGERQQTVERLNSEEQEAEELRQRVATLDRQLGEAKKAPFIVNPAVVFFDLPEETRRGKQEVILRPEQAYIIIFFPLQEASPAPRYQLKVRMRGYAAPIWTSDQFVVQELGEVRAVMPVKVLVRGEYELELLALDGATFRRIAEYELVVRASSDIPRK